MARATEFFVTRIAAGRVQRGLASSLRHCGYHTHAIYPVSGGFLAARSFYTGTGFEHFIDGKELGSGNFEQRPIKYNDAIRRCTPNARAPVSALTRAMHLRPSRRFHCRVLTDFGRPPARR